MTKMHIATSRAALLTFGATSNDLIRWGRGQVSDLEPKLPRYMLLCERPASMSRRTIDIMGTRFVLIPEAELAAIEGPDFPPIDKDGTCEALPFLRASIARDILHERRALGLTQAQLAKLAGIRQETLSRLESGKHKPNVRTVERIEAALKRKRSKR